MLHSTQKPVIVVNLKMMLTTRREVTTYCDRLRSALDRLRAARDACVIVCPSAMHVDIVARCSHAEPRIVCGAQDVFWERRGAFTGQLSPLTLHDAGVEAVLVGHSEQRLYSKGDDAIVGKKARAALSAGITPIIFVGETAQERDRGIMKDVLTEQITAISAVIHAQDLSKILFVYEPVWAIGAPQPPAHEDIMSACIVIRRALAACYAWHDQRVPTRILYGGAVATSGAVALITESGVDGVVFGRAGTDPDGVVRSLCAMTI